MSVKIGHASLDERRQIKNGTAGDQTGKEVCIRTWYNKPWQFVLRCFDSAKAEQMAAACEKGCANPNIGYDQNQRNTLNTQARNTGYDLSKITVPCETDCSAFMTVCAQSAGINIPYSGTNAPTTSTMRNAFLSTGLFQVLTESKYLTGDKHLKRGDILVRPGSHTVMVLENGSSYSHVSDEKSDSTSPYTDAALPPIRQTIKDIQTFLNIRYGSEIHSVLGETLTVDGKMGPKSKRGLSIAFQAELNRLGAGLNIDGFIGTKSAAAFDRLAGPLTRGSKGIFVLLWQCLLAGNHLDPRGIDGSFGPGCASATASLLSSLGFDPGYSVSGMHLNALL